MPETIFHPDGLILTGAPVEELPYHQVAYWGELTAILTHAHVAVPSTLGLCWGGMALAQLLGIDKQTLPSKLFGAFEQRNLTPDKGLLGAPTIAFGARRVVTPGSTTQRWNGRMTPVRFDYWRTGTKLDTACFRHQTTVTWCTSGTPSTNPPG